MIKSTESIKFCEEASTLIDTWKALPKKTNCSFPHKESFSPTSLGKFLRSVFLFEYLESGEIVARVAGTSIREFLEQEITGLNLLDICPPEFKESMASHFTKMMETSCTGYLERPYKTPSGLVQLVRSIQLPLLNKDDKPTFFVGVAKSYLLPEHMADLKNFNWDASRDITTEYAHVA